MKGREVAQVVCALLVFLLLAYAPVLLVFKFPAAALRVGGIATAFIIFFVLVEQAQRIQARAGAGFVPGLPRHLVTAAIALGLCVPLCLIALIASSWYEHGLKDALGLISGVAAAYVPWFLLSAFLESGLLRKWRQLISIRPRGKR